MTQVPLVKRGRLVDERPDEQRFVFFDAGASQKEKLQHEQRRAHQPNAIPKAGNQAEFARTQRSMWRGWLGLRNKMKVDIIFVIRTNL